MSNDFSERIEEFDRAIASAHNLSYIVRDSDLQRAEIERLTALDATLKVWKAEAIKQGNEDHANLILGMECLAAAIISELNMWLLLKSELPEKAWSELVSAQRSTNFAIRAHKNFAKLVAHMKYLDAVEMMVFPPQKFLSAGLLVRQQVCTICRSNYDECPHLVGMPYWGEFCFRELRDFTADHIALVDDPANKDCRITHFSVEGGRRNRMTWRVEPSPPDEQQVDGPDGLRAHGIILSERDLIS